MLGKPSLTPFASIAIANNPIDAKSPQDGGARGNSNLRIERGPPRGGYSANALTGRDGPIEIIAPCRARRRFAGAPEVAGYPFSGFG
jgi:hypothetical protein